MNLSYDDIIRLRASGFQVERKDGKPILPPAKKAPPAPVVIMAPVKKWQFDYVRDDYGRLKEVTATAID